MNEESRNRGDDEEERRIGQAGEEGIEEVRNGGMQGMWR